MLFVAAEKAQLAPSLGLPLTAVGVLPSVFFWLLTGEARLGASSLLDSLAVGCRFEPAVGGTSEALRVAVLPIREGKCLPGVSFATNGQ